MTAITTINPITPTITSTAGHLLEVGVLPGGGGAKFTKISRGARYSECTPGGFRVYWRPPGGVKVYPIRTSEISERSEHYAAQKSLVDRIGAGRTGGRTAAERLPAGGEDGEPGANRGVPAAGGAGARRPDSQPQRDQGGAGRESLCRQCDRAGHPGHQPRYGRDRQAARAGGGRRRAGRPGLWAGRLDLLDRLLQGQRRAPGAGRQHEQPDGGAGGEPDRRRAGRARVCRAGLSGRCAVRTRSRPGRTAAPAGRGARRLEQLPVWPRRQAVLAGHGEGAGGAHRRGCATRSPSTWWPKG